MKFIQELKFYNWLLSFIYTYIEKKIAKYYLNI